MLISLLNIMFVIMCLMSQLDQYLPATLNSSHSALSVLCTYMLSVSADFAVSVLLESIVVHFLEPADKQNVNVP
jgi:hypothetical protein